MPKKMAIALMLVLVGVVLAAKNKVENVHLAATSSPNDMVISWWTKNPANSTCYYGPSSLQYTATGDQTHYGGYHTGYNHNVKLTGLTPDTVYTYSCGDPLSGMSDTYSFKTRASQLPQFTFGVYGDMGTSQAAETMDSVTRKVSKGDWEFIWHLGDISYANDQLNYEGTWNEWFQGLAAPLTQIPYMVSPGNHEKWSRDPVLSPDSNNFTAYEMKFRMPGPESGTNTSLFYSFDYGPVHIISINTESGYTNYPVDPEPISEKTNNPHGYVYPNMANADQEYYFQMNWLVADLQAAVANRANVPWIFVGGHRPVYEANEQKNGVPRANSKNVQAWLEPLFIEYGVDIYFAGHSHHYTRNWPVQNNVVVQTNYTNPPCTTYIVHGAAGNIEGHEELTSNLPSWFAFGDDVNYGYGEITIFNATHLQWRAYAAETDVVVDEIILSRTR